MKIGISITIIALINMLYLELGYIINNDYLTGCFIGGFFIILMEMIYYKYINCEDSKR